MASWLIISDSMMRSVETVEVPVFTFFTSNCAGKSSLGMSDDGALAYHVRSFAGTVMPAALCQHHRANKTRLKIS